MFMDMTFQTTSTTQSANSALSDPAGAMTVVGACPVTGLPVRARPEWINVYCSRTFRCSYKIIGDRIILIQGDGFSDFTGEKIAVDTGNRIMDQAFGPDAPCIMLQDWTKFRGAKFRARKYFIDDLVQNKRLIGLIFCNGTEFQNMSVRMGLSLKIIPYVGEIEKDYPAAIRRALKILEDHGLEPDTREAGSGGAPLLELKTLEASAGRGSIGNRIRSRLKGITGSLTGRDVARQHIDDLLRYLESINYWDGREDPARDIDVDPAHPFLPIFDAITVIKSQIGMMLAERDRIEEHLEELVRKRTDALRQSEMHYRGIYENAPVGIFLCTTDGTMIGANLQMARIFNFLTCDAFLSAANNPGTDGLAATGMSPIFERIKMHITSPGEWHTFDIPVHIHTDQEIHVRVSWQYTESNDIIEGFCQDITIEKKAEKVLVEQATMDKLTGLFNRWILIQMLEKEFERSLRYTFPLSVCMLDIDHFKSVNDRYGHIVGDRVLKEVANIIGGKLRNADISARYGGEEFCAILPHMNAENAKVIMERIRLAIENMACPIEGDVPARVTISIGIAERDDTVTDPGQMIERADFALYTAKRSGRNRTCIFFHE